MRYLQLCSLLLALSACSTHIADIDVACEIDPQHNYLLKWETMPRIEGEVQIYQSTNPERFDTERPPVKTAKIQTGYILIPDTLKRQRSYFLLRFNDRDEHVVGARAERLKYIEISETWAATPPKTASSCGGARYSARESSTR